MKTFNNIVDIRGLFFVLLVACLIKPGISNGSVDLPCLSRITSMDALVVADSDGRIIIKKNETKKCIPASTIKLLTALTAIHHLGRSFRFRTEFYLDSEQNLKIKGFGDPLLVSEVLKEIAEVLSGKANDFKDLVLDITYFSRHIRIPGRECSTNPYDAPVGALCANFNTVFFDHDEQGRIISAEPQTPLIPFAQIRVQSLGTKRGRYTFSHDRREAACYTGKLLQYFLKQRGVKGKGKIRLDHVQHEDRLIYTYRSKFTLEQVLKKMMKFSNNFVANQIFIALGAQEYGPPGTLAKGVNVVSDYAKKYLHLDDIHIVEGSGISRENHLSAMDMLTVLKHFKPYRYLLNRKGEILCKTGALKGIKARAGYIERNNYDPYYFVIFFNRVNPDIKTIMECIKGLVDQDSL